MVLKVNHEDLSKLIKQYYNKKLALFVWGTFGIGKSRVVLETAQAIAKEKGKEFKEWNKSTEKNKGEILRNPQKYFVFIDIRLSEYDSSDIKGLPDFTGERKTIEWKIPNWAEFTSLPCSDGILFFDEINLAPNLVQGSCYKIIYDRIINEEKMSENWLIMGAGNKDNDNAFTHTIPAPLKDRGGEVELTIPDIDDWIKWAIKENFDSRIIGFLNFKKSNLHKVDFNDGQKYTTARGWERVNTLIQGVELGNIGLILKSAIGEGVASEFGAFCKIQERLNLEDLIKHPEKIKDLTEKDIDVKYFLVSALADKYSIKKVDFEKIVEISKVLDEIKGVEFVALLWRMCIGYSEKQFSTDFMNTKKGVDLKIIDKYSKYIL